ncbi:MAG: FecR domain-containing protein, partial [Cyclobacteriaceae bacterium]|nr:FecR domain-containing protein [Cyclobacteriaceae bacterium]
MKKKDIYAIFVRYLTKTTIDKDEENLNSWINESEENESLFEKLENHWNSPGYRQISILKSEEVKKEIWDRANFKQFYNKDLNKKKSINTFLKYAAVLLIFISSISAVFFQLIKDSAKQSTIQLISKSNSAGRKSTIHLKDGTIVNLNSESEISYQEPFSDTARIIWLTGEAFFDVAHDKTKPFYVISQNLKIEALGTSFTVSGYPDNDVVQVSLSTGKVKVNKYDSINAEDILNEVELMPGQKVSFQKNINIFSPVSTYDPLEVEGWKDGI